MSDGVPPLVGHGDGGANGNGNGRPAAKLRLGGMALGNGLLVHGPTHWAAAVRDDAGEILVASGSKPSFGGDAADSVPGVRGVLKLAEAMAVIPLVKIALPPARLPMQSARTAVAALAATLLGQAIRGRGERTLVREGAAGLVSLAPALIELSSGDLASYHAVEHKSIAAYEQDGEAAEAEKEHDRCGSHLIGPLLVTATLGNLAVRRLGLRGKAAEAAVTLGSMAVSVEVFAWSERHEGTALARALRRPGYEIQRLIGTREPTAEQLEVGRAALDEILRAESAA